MCVTPEEKEFINDLPKAKMVSRNEAKDNIQALKPFAIVNSVSEIITRIGPVYSEIGINILLTPLDVSVRPGDKFYLNTQRPVVMPEPEAFERLVIDRFGFGPSQLCLLSGGDLKVMFDACLDEFKRLNP